MKSIQVINLLVLLLAMCSCRNEDALYIDPRGTDYAGAQSCVQCHKDISHSALITAHLKATAPATAESVLGSFASGQNTFAYGNDSKVAMEKHGDSLYQVWYKNGKIARSHTFDIVFGGRNAQTAVYWHNLNTYELPVSFYRSINGWGTSPGFSPSEPYFDRKMTKDCYACHSSNVRNTDAQVASDARNFMSQDIEDVIHKEKIIYGIDCERCHGPAKKHVGYHLKFPNVKTGHDIVSYKSLSNQQKLDACSICHAGSDGMKIKSRFDFKPGDNLNDYYRPLPDAKIDVHGNQHGMLTQSKCFTKSGTMNCTTCHDPHQNASKQQSYYAKICLSCHTSDNHKKETLALLNPVRFRQNCVQCHMPKESSNAISFHTSFKSELSNYQLRTHKIAIYANPKSAD